MRSTSSGVLALALLSATTAPTAHAQSPITGIWQFDETMGTTARDVGPYQNDGTLVNFGATNPWVSGRYGNALSFDGVDDYVDIAFNFGLPLYANLGEPFSICMWIRGSATDDDRVLSLSSSTASEPLLTFGTGRTSLLNEPKLQIFRRHDDGNTRPSRYSNADVFDDTWHHVAYVEHSSYGQIYVDGVLDATFPIDNGARPLTTDILTLGAIHRPSNATPVCCAFTGDLDDVQVYTYALTATDVMTVMAGSFVGTFRGSFGEYGASCNGLGTFGGARLQASGSPTLGGGLEFRVFRGASNAVPLLFLAPGRATPTDLAPFGAVDGCTLYTDVARIVTLPMAPLDAFGSSLAPASIPIPNTRILDAFPLVFQGFHATPNLWVTNAVVVTVGS